MIVFEKAEQLKCKDLNRGHGDSTCCTQKEFFKDEGFARNLGGEFHLAMKCVPRAANTILHNFTGLLSRYRAPSGMFAIWLLSYEDLGASMKVQLPQRIKVDSRASENPHERAPHFLCRCIMRS